jgi:hypothetical protein
MQDLKRGKHLARCLQSKIRAAGYLPANARKYRLHSFDIGGTGRLPSSVDEFPNQLQRKSPRSLSAFVCGSIEA